VVFAIVTAYDTKIGCGEGCAHEAAVAFEVGRFAEVDRLLDMTAHRATPRSTWIALRVSKEGLDG